MVYGWDCVGDEAVMSQPVILYMTQWEDVDSPFECRPHRREVQHLYQMLWTDDKLIFRYIGKHNLDERTIFDPRLSWRYVMFASAEDFIFEAKSIREMDVYVPLASQVQYLELKAEVQAPRLMAQGTMPVEENYTFFIWQGYEQAFLNEIREYSKCANVELKESSRLPDPSVCGKVLTSIMIVLWIASLLTYGSVLNVPALILLSLLPGAAAILLLFLFPHKLVSGSDRSEAAMRNFAQISMLGFSLVPQFSMSDYEILGGLRLLMLGAIVFAAMAVMFLLRVRVWKVRPKHWIVPLVAMLIFSFPGFNTSIIYWICRMYAASKRPSAAST